MCLLNREAEFLHILNFLLIDKLKYSQLVIDFNEYDLKKITRVNESKEAGPSDL